MKNNHQTPEFRQLLRNHFTLLKPYRNKKNAYIAEIRLRGYSDIAYRIADLLKVSIMAMDSDNNHCASPTITEPNVNILGVLEMALALLPYEEFELLDILYEQLLEFNEAEQTQSPPQYNYSTQRLLGPNEKMRNYFL